MGLGSKSHLKYIWKNKLLLCMLLPGLVMLLINNYVPMFGVIIAFKKYTITGKGFLHSLINSPWVSPLVKNFEFFTKTVDAMTITRNTVLYNLSFIALDLLLAVPLAIAMSLIRQKKTAKFTQTVLFLPHFMSWVVVSYLVSPLPSMNTGFINTFLLRLPPQQRINWYSVPKYWPLIIPVTWKA